MPLSPALVGIWLILLTAFVATILYVGRQLLIPLALAAMLPFLLAPLVQSILLARQSERLLLVDSKSETPPPSSEEP